VPTDEERKNIFYPIWGAGGGDGHVHSPQVGTARAPAAVLYCFTRDSICSRPHLYARDPRERGTGRNGEKDQAEHTSSALSRSFVFRRRSDPPPHPRVLSRARPRDRRRRRAALPETLYDVFIRRNAARAQAKSVLGRFAFVMYGGRRQIAFHALLYWAIERCPHPILFVS